MNKQVTQSEAAELLGVSRGQVHMWWKRRARNGFPERVTDKPVYDAQAILAWRDQYVPGRGGRPRK